MSGLANCPFCGGAAIMLKDHKKLGLYVACQSCFGASRTGKQAEVIAAWNRRAPASAPEDVAGVVERLRGYRPANEWGDPVQHTICDEAASALARVAKERDEARATLDEVCLSNRQEWQRATSAEAKLAEARKVARECADLLTDLDLGRSIHNGRFPDNKIDGPLWAQIGRVTSDARTALGGNADA